jgi:hypothetical protein
MKTRCLLVHCSLLLLATRARAQADTTVIVKLGAFVDAYYAWDFGRPPSFDRSFIGGTPFTTQPARHNEFNVNLAFIEARIEGARIRGRVALQAGTSVQSNYAAEPNNGAVSGASMARHIQEAVAGYELRDNLWVDGGIYLSHLGMESWISRDNPTYTRSLVAEYSPYYQSGVKATWKPTTAMTAQLHVVNGWQNISENNSSKGVGARIDYAPSSTTTMSYYNLITEESGNRLRTFNGVGAKLNRGKMTVTGEADVGTQQRSVPDGRSASWYGLSAIARYQLTGVVAVAGRLERYNDPDQVMVATGTNVDGVPNGALRADGGSFGIDISPQSRLNWRTEIRASTNRSAIFPDGAAVEPRKLNAVTVSSLAITF